MASTVRRVVRSAVDHRGKPFGAPAKTVRLRRCMRLSLARRLDRSPRQRTLKIEVFEGSSCKTWRRNGKLATVLLLGAGIGDVEAAATAALAVLGDLRQDGGQRSLPNVCSRSGGCRCSARCSWNCSGTLVSLYAGPDLGR